jgi:hypothetical protein
MEELIRQSIKTGLAYLKATNNSCEAWAVIERQAATLGEEVKNKIMSGIKAGL